MRDYPQMIVPTGHVEPAPRRVRAFLGGQMVLDTTSARYVWESPKYPQYHVPVGDIDPELLVDEDYERERPLGTARRHGLRVGELTRPKAAWVYAADAGELAGLAVIEWDALDAWFEEDEQVFVHPRNPYTRVDALRSARNVRIELEGVSLAESAATVMVFETGLPTRYYFDRTDVNFEHLVVSEASSECPYKGRTSGYWSVRAGEELHPDVAWTYDFPTRQLLPIAGLVAFLNEQVDVIVDDRSLPRPTTHFSQG